MSVPAQVCCIGRETKLLVQSQDAAPAPKPDRSLLRLLGQAHWFGELVMAGQGRSIVALASEAGVCPYHFARVLRLCFLAPEITRAILLGKQPPALTANKLKRIGRPATLWSTQRQQLGFH